MNVDVSIGKFEEYLGVRGWTERPHQRETIEEIVRYFEEGKKLVMLNAPTGFGKTMSNWAVAMGCESAYYVTGNLSLQDQIISDEYPEVADIRGRSNYKCSMVDADCSEGLCQLKNKFKCEEVCSYNAAKQEALDSRIMLSNLMYFILEGGKSFKKRELLIIDEAHNLPEQLIGFSRATISTRTANKEIGERALELHGELSEIRLVNGEGVRVCDGENAVNYLKEIVDAVYDAVEDFEGFGELEDKELKEFKKLRGLAGRLQNCVDAGGAIVSRSSTWNKDYSWIVIQPLLSRKISDKLIFSRADKVLLSSATINRYLMAQELGFVELLGKGKSVYLPVESTFPVERRPLYLQPIVNFKYKNQTEENENKMKLAIAEIVHKHKGEKGIIFCQGYRYVKMIEDVTNCVVKDPEYGEDGNYTEAHKERMDLSDEIYRRLLFHDKDNRKEVLKKWMGSFDDSVLVGINMTEGLDLKYDMCRFSIVFKAPFADSRDPRVSARINLSHWQWYNMLAQQVLMQAYGRIMRSEDDRGSMYVLCEGACKLIKRKGTSQYVKEAIVELSGDGSEKKK